MPRLQPISPSSPQGWARLSLSLPLSLLITPQLQGRRQDAAAPVGGARCRSDCSGAQAPCARWTPGCSRCLGAVINRVPDMPDPRKAREIHILPWSPSGGKQTCTLASVIDTFVSQSVSDISKVILVDLSAPIAQSVRARALCAAPRTWSRRLLEDSGSSPFGSTLDFYLRPCAWPGEDSS